MRYQPLPAELFVSNRQHLYAKLPPQSVVIVHANDVLPTNADGSIGFVQNEAQNDGDEAIKRVFSPEFRNRLDAIVQFAPLTTTTIERVVDKVLLEVEAQLEQKGVQVSIDEDARRWIAKKGYDPKMGARPMARLVQERIKRPLAEELLFGKLAGGGTVRVMLAKDGEGLELESRGIEEPVLLK